MKTILLLAVISLCGCARFGSTQIDNSYEKGQPIRTITTKTKSTTFFASKSDLSKYKALTTDKTQSLGIGSLNQESTNGADIVRSAVGAAVEAAIKARPTP